MDPNHVLPQNYAVTSAGEQWFSWMSRFYRNINNCWSSKRGAAGRKKSLYLYKLTDFQIFVQQEEESEEKVCFSPEKDQWQRTRSYNSTRSFSWSLTIKYECKCRSKKTLKHSLYVSILLSFFYVTYSGADNACSISTLYHPIKSSDYD